MAGDLFPPLPPRPPPAPHCDLYWEMSLEKGCLGTVLWGSGPILRCKHEPNPGTPPPPRPGADLHGDLYLVFVMSLYISAVLVAMPSFRGLPVPVLTYSPVLLSCRMHMPLHLSKALGSNLTYSEKGLCLPPCNLSFPRFFRHRVSMSQAASSSKVLRRSHGRPTLISCPVATLCL